MKDHVEIRLRQSEGDEELRPTSISKDSDSRKELLWEEREQNLLLRWKDQMEKQAKLHKKSGRRYKKLYAIFGVPSALIPIITSGLTNFISPLTQSILMITTGTLIGISTFFNLGRKYTEHLEFQARYDELARDLEKELAKPKRHRVACDVYMERIYLQFSGLNARAPLTLKSPDLSVRRLILPEKK